MTEGLALVEKFYGSFKKADWKALSATFAANCVTVTPGGPVNVEQHEQMIRSFKIALPDAQMEITNKVESGEWIAIEGRFKGKHEKDLVGPAGTIPAKGKNLDLPYADFFRVRDGKIVEHRVYWDQASMLAQLGAMPG